ncbi:AfsR/SARP family transcriptional regulator [Kitasatospora camelliae]|uniref:BTAD domain-containing putative transcriptional regulator n=1 Tax=Kitasatospora camelliae TaxID=3156397 RepID=A0AAU8K7I0_9ACTN
MWAWILQKPCRPDVQAREHGATGPVGRVSGCHWGGCTVEFRLLGPVELQAAGGTVALGPHKQRLVLAALMADAGQVVPAGTLIRRVWDEHPPQEAQSSLYTYVARLRAVLRTAAHPSDQDAPAIGRTGGGYRLDTGTSRVDLRDFRELAARARTTVGDLQGTRALLDRALGLWRGQALSGQTGGWADALRLRLEREHFAVRLQRHDTHLALGGHAELLPELLALAGEQPDDEALIGQLMLALYRCGRAAEALGHYERMRRRLADRIGADPGARLRELHQRILRDDPLLSPPRPADAVQVGAAGGAADGDSTAARPERIAPAELPHPISGFTGRADRITALDRLILGGTASRTGPVIVAISGTAGVGKTALAVHWAHLARDSFPDGQLWIGLRGFDRDREPVRPADALGQLLRSLGQAPAQIPEDEDEQARLYRSLLTGRRVLIVLDNAASAEQVRPLLPGSASCAVLVTSRYRLGGLVALDGAVPLPLGAMPPTEAQDLLAQVVGEDLRRAEPEATAELAQYCGHLPLALRVAAAQLALGTHSSVAGFVERLRAGNRLDGLVVDGDGRSAVRSAFSLSYLSLPEDTRRLFRGLGLVPGPDFTPAAVAALASVPRTEAERLLATLRGAHLLESAAPGRFHLHDLLREFARELGEAEDPEQIRRSALDGLFDWYRRTAETSVSALPWVFPHLPETFEVATTHAESAAAAAQQAMAVLESEQPNLIAAIEHAAAHPPARLAWELTATLARYFWTCAPRAVWQAAAETALSAAVAEGSQPGTAAMHRNLGLVHWDMGHIHEARAHHRSALALHERIGPPVQLAMTLGALGLVGSSLGRLHEALDHFGRCLAVCRTIGRPDFLQWPLTGLGTIHRDLGDFRTAVEFLGQAVTCQQQAGSRFEAIPRQFYAQALWESGRLTEAAAELERLLAVNQPFGQNSTDALAYDVLARIAIDQGDYRQGLAEAERAAQLAHDGGRPIVRTGALNTAGTALRNLGRFDEARQSHEHALRLARSCENPRAEADSLIGLAAARRRLGRPDESLQAAQLALDLALRHTFRLVEAQAQTELAEERLAHDPRAALHLARAALSLHRSTGHQLGVARTYSLLADIHQALGDAQIAEAERTAAAELRLTIGAAAPAYR